MLVGHVLLWSQKDPSVCDSVVTENLEGTKPHILDAWI